mmetsp:Transcript_8653/g.39370  ORF Transcript_8653/g.39370 Transcript_8653/m.39370 type:complete len:715 (-) Transcript_8653:906-3050(-)
MMNLSRPGLRDGMRTALCSHIFRLLRRTRVPWILLENVPGLLMWHLAGDPPQEPAIAYIVQELESLGYSWAHRVVSLSAFGLPQRRRRVFIVASLHGDPRDVLLSTESICKGQCIDVSKADVDPRPAAECYECFMTPPHVTPKISVTCVDLAEKRFCPLAHEICTLTTSNGRRLCMVEDLGDGKGRAFRLEVEDAERLSGFPVGWTEPCFPLKAPGRPWMRAVDTNPSYTKRMELLGRAVSIPQARWIGQRLISPYEFKFSRECEGVKFSKPVPSLPSVATENRDNDTTLYAWPSAAWNILSSPEIIKLSTTNDPGSSLWHGRRGLPHMTEAPEICSFTPLGEFLSSAPRREVDSDALSGFISRAVEHGIKLAPFVCHAFGIPVPAAPQAKQRKQPKPKVCAGQNQGEHAGEVVWIPTKMSKMKCFWPGIALHLDEDRDVIPTYAIEKIKPGQTSDSHRMVVYFAEESYEWMSKDGILPFCEYFDELEKQPLLASRAKYRKAVELALEWQINQDGALENLYDVRLRQLHAQEAEKLRRKIGNLGEIPHVTCGVCIVCQSKKHESQIIPFSERHIPRASTRQMKCSPLKGVRSGQNCPQLRVLSAAKKGSISAQLALLREKAVGRRIEIYWHVDRKFYPATITAFDDQNYLHRVEHDDGDIEPAVKLWELRINLLVQDDEKEALQGNASQTITTETPRARKRAAGVKRFWPFGSK